MTPLDQVYAALAANADDAARHGQFYGQVAATELHLVLDGPAGEDKVTPLVLEAGEDEVVLAFDTAERMANFMGRPAEFVSLPGRVIIEMLQGSGLTLGLNFEAPSQMMMPPDVLDWMSERLAQSPQTPFSDVDTYAQVVGLPEAALEALDMRLAGLAGLAAKAHLILAIDPSEQSQMVMVVEEAVPGAQMALEKALGEVAAFNGLTEVGFALEFWEKSDPRLAQVTPHALSFELPSPRTSHTPMAPGTNPNAPPRLN